MRCRAPSPIAVAPLLAALLLAGCGGPERPAPRVEIVKRGPASVDLVPRPGQPPFCVAFTVSASGLVRQLTPLAPNEAIPCPAGAPIAGVTHRIPKAEGKVLIHVVFADRAIDGRPLGAQVRELGATRRFTAMDLRAPGNVVLETLEFTPEG